MEKILKKIFLPSQLFEEKETKENQSVVIKSTRKLGVTSYNLVRPKSAPPFYCPPSRNIRKSATKNYFHSSLKSKKRNLDQMEILPDSILTSEKIYSSSILQEKNKKYKSVHDLFQVFHI